MPHARRAPSADPAAPAEPVHAALRLPVITPVPALREADLLVERARGLVLAASDNDVCVMQTSEAARGGMR